MSNFDQSLGVTVFYIATAVVEPLRGSATLPFFRHPSDDVAVGGGAPVHRSEEGEKL